MKTAFNLTPKFGKVAIVLLLLISTLEVLGTNYYFYVQFCNKNNSPYSLSNPSVYLSQRAIDRRIGRMAELDSTDLPVNPSYLEGIRNLGITIHSKSKWMNGATVTLTDSMQMAQVRTLPYIKFVQYTGKIEGAVLVSPSKKTMAETPTYGIAGTQIDQLNGKYLHNLGFRGKDVWIGVLDAGFANVDSNPAFDSLRLQGRLLGTKDIIDPNSNIYTKDAHGAMVLSTMGGNKAGQFLGTAPDASYLLIRTEYAPTETLMETDFWCSGIEYADSVGVDIINSSLGYTIFDDSSMDFSYADMNGKVARCSRAAELAAKKGIIVLNSAGNDAAKPWHYIGAPADARGILAVGSITASGIASSFSSWGPSADLRIKPEVCAMGSNSGIINTDGFPSFGSGTSFASPIMAGMVACLVQAFKNQQATFKIDTLINAVIQTGSLLTNPTDQMGFGIPNFQTAYTNLSTLNGAKNTVLEKPTIHYNGLYKTIIVRFQNSTFNTPQMLTLYNTSGQAVLQQSLVGKETAMLVSSIQAGVYILTISGVTQNNSFKVIIH